MDNSTKLYIAIQVCQALNYLHTSKPQLMHLDVKPSNVMVSVYCTVYIYMLGYNSHPLGGTSILPRYAG